MSYTKNEIAYKRIKDDIISGRFKSGEFLIERQLGETLELSRTPIREALRRLQNEGFVEFIQNKGIFVGHIKVEDVKQIYQIRERLDPLALELCMRDNKEEFIESLSEYINLQNTAIRENDYQGFLNSDMMFHNEYVLRSKNERLIIFSRQLGEQIRRIYHLSYNDFELAERSFNAHCSILKAIEENQIEKASEALRRHLVDIKNHYINKMIQ